MYLYKCTYLCPYYYLKLNNKNIFYHLAGLELSPAPRGQHSLHRAHRLPRVSHQERDVTQLRHGGEEFHVLRQARLVLEDVEVRLVPTQEGGGGGNAGTAVAVQLDLGVPGREEEMVSSPSGSRKHSVA